MRQRILFLGLFVIGSGMFLGRATNAPQLSKCEIAAINIHESLQAAGYSHADAYQISGMALEWCEWANKY